VVVLSLRAWPYFVLSLKEGDVDQTPAITYLWTREGEWGNANQQFQWNGASGTLCLVSKPTKCLTAINGAQYSFADLERRQHVGGDDSVGLMDLSTSMSSQQSWKWTSETGALCLRTDPSKCLSATREKIFNSARLQTYNAAFGGNANERNWIMTEQGACRKGQCGAHAACYQFHAGTSSCICQKGYTGDGSRCEETNACLSSPCANDGRSQCVRTGPGLYQCK